MAASLRQHYEPPLTPTSHVPTGCAAGPNQKLCEGSESLSFPAEDCSITLFFLHGKQALGSTCGLKALRCFASSLSDMPVWGWICLWTVALLHGRVCAAGWESTSGRMTIGCHFLMGMQATHRPQTNWPVHCWYLPRHWGGNPSNPFPPSLGTALVPTS